jgi:outer membrane lipoprotein LolB
LISKLLGTVVPVAALFDWLNGRHTEIDGWQVDLTQFNVGKIVAQREMPAPEAKIRILLDQ